MTQSYDVISAMTIGEAIKVVNKKYPVGGVNVFYSRRKNKVGKGYFWSAEIYK